MSAEEPTQHEDVDSTQAGDIRTLLLALLEKRRSRRLSGKRCDIKNVSARIEPSLRGQLYRAARTTGYSETEIVNAILEFGLTILLGRSKGERIGATGDSP